MSAINLTISELRQAYSNNTLTAESVIFAAVDKAKAQQADTGQAIWLNILSEQQINAYLANLKDKSPQTHPLYGIPFAIKDNIDLAHVPTTAACPQFSYIPEKSAFVVEKLIDAGAIPIGKTNLDQFATGLVGTRSPYGETPNAFNADYISGGSSSGSAVATASATVSFALGTDTAGSGRVPACFNNLIGLKPTKGLLSTAGVVPACRSLDCVSIFALTANDANTVFQVAAEYDVDDCYARTNPLANQQPVAVKQDFTFAIPLADQLEFFGDQAYQTEFNKAVSKLEKLGGHKLELDFSPMLQAAKLLYEGPWVAERYLATKEVIENTPQAMLEVTHSIISAGNKPFATDCFAALYKLQALKKQADLLVEQADFLVTPTAGRHYTRNEISQNPIGFNSNLGYYTNFMNLLDFAAIAVPTSFTSNKMPFGITLFSFALQDQKLLAYADKIMQHNKLSLGATNLPFTSAPLPSNNLGFIDIVVCGAHLSGMALNWQLTERNAVLLEQTTTAKAYQMYAVAGTVERPALIRSNQNTQCFEVEVWRMPTEHFASFVQGIAQPLGIGKVELIDGRFINGFIAESSAQTGKNISEFGSWRKYKQTQ
ncbi:allophanate hydrolase [Catenovulum agarivorans DS-2]|uniref:Allophanate hydrolase n=1 Tax=Catenovulum agarivorans DS-2 TaxID=1328313 RepID=W7QJD0_9ALTE|nr:allophanate hydrolase [Catenovulum agarivorans]EWH09057.1 allophanate hydrolase [Catenovulum agarivorans DS-2]